MTNSYLLMSIFFVGGSKFRKNNIFILIIYNSSVEQVPQPEPDSTDLQAQVQPRRPMLSSP